MADVSGDGDRAQLFLVGALAFAVMLVALAVLLNAAIYTENLATQGVTTSPDDAIEYREAAASAATNLLRTGNVNHNESFVALRSGLSDGMASWSEAAGKHRATQGHAANASVASVNRGSRIGRDTVGNFTDRDDDAAWTPAKNTETSYYRANVSRTSLADSVVLGSVGAYINSTYYRVEFDDGTNNWTAYVYDDGSAVAVDVVNDTDTLPSDTCTAAPGPNGFVTIDFVEARVGGEHCAPLDFHDQLDGDYTIRFERATNVEGTFSLVVDKDESALDTSPLYDDEAAGEPYNTTALYSATLDIHYRGADVEYQTTERVFPGENDA